MCSEPRIGHERLPAHATHPQNPAIFRMIAFRFDVGKHFVTLGEIRALEHFSTK